MMQQRRLIRLRSVSLLRFIFVFALTTISLAALLSYHIFPAGKVPLLHVPLAKHEIAIERRIGELHWTTESSPPQLLKESSQKLDKVNGMTDLSKLWRRPSNRSFTQCVEPSESYEGPNGSEGYLLVHTNGGLNQMRAGISDMVAVARIINATLVIPELDKQSFWQDSSNFSDVFDEEHFVSSLISDVKIVKKLPKEMLAAPKILKHFRSWSGLEYYMYEISSLWKDYEVIQAAKSDSRLANNNLPSDVQKLRCRAFYEALRFSPRIEALGKLLVERMRSYGPYIALHLRYEKDMLAFSGCTYGLSSAEADELTTIRENTAHWKVKDIDPEEQRAKGYCPLTPKEVGIFLTSLGYLSNTPIYIASGEIYGGDSHMTDLRSHFPFLMSKEKLASPEELEPFKEHASQLAALDYIVSVESDVFVPSYSGNMARAVEGHRRFLGLVHLFDKVDRGLLKSPKKLSGLIIEMHKKRQGSPRKRKGPLRGTRGMERFRSEEVFYENPLPDCICRKGAYSTNSATTGYRAVAI
ncbi:Uncharacterized protein EJ110_NYTH08702 [Nymphaea thermarum]|nr:Uncharacterized protein EJ110_NYTH08702 [Nymphaea thermarum]